MKLLPASGHKVQRWKNGGGTTTEIAVHPEDAGLDDFDWRVSMAAMSADGPFSAFPGIARTLAILDGPGIVLGGESFGERTLTRNSVPFAFDGGEPVDCRLLGGLTTDLNLMSRADRYRHTMGRLSISGTLRLEPISGVRLIVLVEGTASVSDRSATLTLAPFDALRDEGEAALELSATRPAVAFVLTITPLG